MVLLKTAGVAGTLFALMLLGASVTEMIVDCAQDSLQAAIETASEGATITVAEGLCRGNIVISKNLSVRGMGAERTTLQGVKTGFPVLLIQSDHPISVMIDRLTLADAPKASNDPQHGKECARFYPELLCPSGFQVRGEAQAFLTEARVIRNPWVGVYVLDTARVTADNTEIVENGWGVYVSPRAHVELTQSRVERNRENGIEIWGSALITTTIIRANGRAGAEILGEASFIANEIFSNKQAGILLSGLSQAEITSNGIADNGTWGIAAYLRKCGYLSDGFNGSVTTDQNRVLNNRAGDICLP